MIRIMMEHTIKHNENKIKKYYDKIVNNQKENMTLRNFTNLFFYNSFKT